ncbi:unnamed protein product [Moneuplotes crassus]|uniref:Uncharacterized protein n=1 Tax=Euplotes crassus TaxID=5936 RepID=A0AAD1X8S1_EUPCR|nr:unnamed protein product [Moneuplotes crassus]
MFYRNKEEWPKILNSMYSIEEETPQPEEPKEPKEAHKPKNFANIGKEELNKHLSGVQSIELRINNSTSILDVKQTDKESSRSSTISIRKNLNENYDPKMREKPPSIYEKVGSIHSVHTQSHSKEPVSKKSLLGPAKTLLNKSRKIAKQRQSRSVSPSKKFQQRREKWVYKPSPDELLNRDPSPSEFRSRCRTNMKNAIDEIKRGFNQNIYMKKVISNIKNRTRIKLNKAAMSVPKIWMSQEELQRTNNAKYKITGSRLKTIFGNKAQNVPKNRNKCSTKHEGLSYTMNTFEYADSRNMNKSAQGILKASNSGKTIKFKNEASPIDYSTTFQCELGNSFESKFSTCNTNDPRVNFPDLDNINEGPFCNSKTMIIQDNQEMKTYSVHEDDFYSNMDSKLGKSLIDLINEKSPNSRVRNKDLRKDSRSRMNFKLPSFPFCKTCNKNNTDFLQNKNYLVFRDERSNSVLYPKDSFISKLQSGELEVANGFKNIKMIHKAIEDYQIKNGASPERDFDYSFAKK